MLSVTEEGHFSVLEKCLIRSRALLDKAGRGLGLPLRDSLLPFSLLIRYVEVDRKHLHVC